MVGMMTHLAAPAGFVVLGNRHGEAFILCVDLCVHRHLLSLCVPSLLHWLRAEGLGGQFSLLVSPFNP